MKKDYSATVREYVSEIGNEDLHYLHIRMKQRLPGDMAEASEKLNKFEKINTWLASALDNSEFFDMMDALEEAIDAEVRKCG